MFFHGDQPVLGPQQFGGDQRRAGIGVRIGGKGQIGLERFSSVSQPAQFFDSGLRLARTPRFIRGQIVTPAPGMTVQHRKGRFLAPQMQKNPYQSEMFDHIGEIAGVKGVAVIHMLLAEHPDLGALIVHIHRQVAQMLNHLFQILRARDC